MCGMGMSHLQCGDMDTYISMFGQVVQIRIEYHYKDKMQAGKQLVSKRGSGSETSKRPGYEANKCEVNLLGYEMVILDLVLV